MANELDSKDESTAKQRSGRGKKPWCMGAILAACVLVFLVEDASAETIAGAEGAEPSPPTQPSARPTPMTRRPRAPARSAALASPPVSPAPASVGLNATSALEPPDSAPTAQSTQTSTTVNVIGPSSRGCLPDCRAGFVCREGECVSACNPTCGEGEICNAKRECVPAPDGAGSDKYTYDKTRFGIGGGVGVASGPDGTGTPASGHVAVAIPLGGHWYTREDIMVAYHTTSTDDRSYVGATVSPVGTTTVDQSYLLVALRATGGYQFNSLLGMRLGALAGSHTLKTEHGFCGVGYAEKSASSFAIGGTGAIALAFKHVDLSAVVDVYSAETQQLCSLPVTGVGGLSGQPAGLYASREIVSQFLAQGTILF